MQNKPVIDYKSKIRILEKEVSYFNQCYNSTKGENEILINELKELRKNTINTKIKVKELNEKLAMAENEYNQNKEEIKKKIETNEDNEILKEIQNGEKLIKHNTNLMIQELKSNDHDMARKLAKEKFYQYEHKKLLRKRKNIRKKWEMERKKFFDQMNEEIKKQNLFDPSSKLLETIGDEKISKLVETLQKFYEETNINDIESLVDYFLKCSKEFKNFCEFINKLNKDMESLEKEVDELEYIINFCQKNLEIKTDNLPDDEYKNEIELYKKSAEVLIHMQYFALNEVYRNFCNKFTEALEKNFEQENKDSNNVHDKIDDGIYFKQII